MLRGLCGALLVFASALAAPAGAPVPVTLVVTGQGQPVGGVEARFYKLGPLLPDEVPWQWGEPTVARTDLRGEARVSLEPGGYLVSVRPLAGAAWRSFEVVPAGSAAWRISLSPGAGTPVVGRIRQESAAPLVAPRAELIPRVALPDWTFDAPAGERIEVEVDTAGRFAPAVQAGAYRLEVGAARSLTRTGHLSAPLARELDAVLFPAALLRGRVLDSEGTPRPGARVVAWAWNMSVEGIAREDGRFAIEVAPGTWMVSADDGELAGTVERPLLVGRGGAVLEPIRLAAGASIAGHVEARGGRPLDARVYLRPAKPTRAIFDEDTSLAGVLRSTPVAPDGSFRFVGLPGGSWHLFAQARGFVSTPGVSVAVATGQAFERLRLLLTVPSKAPLEGGDGVVEGLVVDEQGRPVPGAVVSANTYQCGTFPAPGFLAERLAFSDALGRFRVLPGPGAFGTRVEARRRADEPAAAEAWLQGEDYGMGAFPPVRLVLAQGAPVARRVIGPAPAGTPSIEATWDRRTPEMPSGHLRVRLAGGKHVGGGTQVFAFRELDQTSFGGSITGDRFEVRGLTPAPWSLAVEGAERWKVEVPALVLAGEPTDLLVDLDSVSGLRASVLDAAGRPTGAVHAELRELKSGRSEWRQQSWLMEDQRNLVVFQPVPPGRYLLEVLGTTAETPGSLERIVELEGGVLAQLDLTLQGGLVPGTVGLSLAEERSDAPPAKEGRQRRDRRGAEPASPSPQSRGPAPCSPC